jgi:hypothetical protein
MREYSRIGIFQFLLWKSSFLSCGHIQELEYFSSFVETFLPAMQGYSRIGIFNFFCGIEKFQGPCANNPSCHAGLFKYQNISGSVWDPSFLPCGNIQISDYFRAHVGAFLTDMREYSNIGIFQGSYGNIPS